MNVYATSIAQFYEFGRKSFPNEVYIYIYDSCPINKYKNNQVHLKVILFITKTV